MDPCGATEMIWHFAGYLRLPAPDITTPPTLYEGLAGKAVPEEDDAASHATARRLPDALDMSSDPVPLPDLTLSDDGHGGHMMPVRLHGIPHAHLQSFKAKVPHDLRPPGPGGGGGGSHGAGHHGDVAYRDGGDQEKIDVHQTNVMHNDDVVGDPATPVPDGSDVLASMLSAADNLVPDAVRAPAGDSATITDLVSVRDAHLADLQAADDPQPVLSEQHRDGVPMADADLHQPTTAALDHALAAVETLFDGSPAATGNGAEGLVQAVSLGGNMAVNDTVVSDYAGMTGTLVVLGDYFRTTSIVQTNVLQHNDWFGVAGDGANGALACTPDAVHNIAEVVAQGGNGAAAWHAGGTFHWSIDTLDGSFYDIKSFVLTNVISDNDTISQVASTGHSEIVLGSNGAVNLSDFSNLSAQYDVIFVQGNYHHSTLLYQTNVVLDCNFATLDNAGTGEGGEAAGSWSILAAGDVLINDARIVDLGSHSFQPVSDGVLDLIQKLENHESFGAAAVKDAFPTLAGTVNALLVTGDYYDVTCVAQTNVVSDLNVATLRSNGGEQVLSTGGNQAINAVTVVDGGSLASPYLKGDFYNDTILVQANIVAESDKVTVNDPAQLASELVAFTATDEVIPSDVLALPSADLQHHNDVLASVLH
jgi:hypothetical protein